MANFETLNHRPEAILAGSFERVTKKRTIAAGQNLKAGAVLGQITVNDKMLLCDKAAIDGSAAPVEILAHDVDATAADMEAITYQTGEFLADQVSLAVGTIIADVEDGLRSLSIFLK